LNAYQDKIFGERISRDGDSSDNKDLRLNLNKIFTSTKSGPSGDQCFLTAKEDAYKLLSNKRLATLYYEICTEFGYI